MASVVIHVDIDIDKIKAKLDKANKDFTKNVAKDIESKFLPKLTGSLAERTRVLDDKIIYPGPYAHYLWEGILYVDHQTGAAGFLLPDGTWRSRAGITKVKSGKSLVFTRASAKPHWIEPAKAEFMSRWEEAYKKSFK